MALHWELGDIEDYRALYNPTGETDKGGSPLFRLKVHTEYLIWSTMTVGIPEITEENWKKFYGRMHQLELIRGPNIWRNNEDGTETWTWTTPELIRRHIGMGTNAATTEDEEWSKQLFRLLEERVTNQMRCWDSTVEELSKDPADRRADNIFHFMPSTPGRGYKGFLIISQNRSSMADRNLFSYTGWDDPPEIIPDSISHGEEEE